MHAVHMCGICYKAAVIRLFALKIYIKLDCRIKQSYVQEASNQLGSRDVELLSKTGSQKS